MLRASVIGGVQYVVSVESRSKYAHSAATRRSRCVYIAPTNDGDATKSRRVKYARGLTERRARNILHWRVG